MGDSMETRFRDRARAAVGPAGRHRAGRCCTASLFHVFGVYPWFGLLREGRVDQPLRVLDRCRIRWGRVVSVAGAEAVVLSRPLLWDGRRLHLGEPRDERAMVGLDGLGLAGTVRPADWCSLHWDWVCERLSLRQVAALRHHTLAQLDVVNGVAAPAPNAVLA